MKYLAAVLTALFLASATAVGISTVDPQPAQAAASGGYVKKCGGGKIFLKSKEKRSFYLHNNARKNRGLKPLCVHPKLQKAARAHSRDMIKRDYFAHGNVGKRLRNFGYNWSTYGENIAWGQYKRGKADPIFKAWMNSDGHRKNILNGKFREVGIGIYYGNFQGHKGVTMWTADFGAR
jgi:uncharacterized protein YkwD